MAIAYVQSKLAKQGTGTPSSLAVTLTNPTAAGNLLVAMVVTVNSPTHAPTGVTDGTTGFTQLPNAQVTWTGVFTNVITDVWYLPSSNAGKTVFTLNVGSACSFLEIWVVEISGFTTPVPDGNPVTNGTAGSTGVANTNTGPTITTTATGAIVAACGTDTGSISANPKAGNEFSSGGDASGDAFCSLIPSSAAGHTPAWTDTGATDNFTSTVAAFKETSGGATLAWMPVETLTHGLSFDAVPSGFLPPR